MSRGVKKILLVGSLTILSLGFYVNEGLPVIKPATDIDYAFNEDEKQVKGTTTYVYSYNKGDLSTEEQKRLGLSSWLSRTTTSPQGEQISATLFLGLTELSSEDEIKLGLVKVGEINVPMFFVQEDFNGKSIAYLSATPDNNSTIFTPLCVENSAIYKVTNIKTGESRLVTFEEASKVASGCVPGERYVGIFDRKQAMLDANDQIVSDFWETARKNEDSALSEKYFKIEAQLQRLEAARDKVASNQRTAMYIYGYSLPEQVIGSGAPKVPEGLMLWSAQLGSANEIPSRDVVTDLFWSFKPLSDEYLAAYPYLTFIGKKDAIGFYKAQTRLDENPLTYIDGSPNGDDPIIGVVTSVGNDPETSIYDPEQLKIYIIQNDQTGTTELCTYQRAIERITYIKDDLSYSFIDINNKYNSGLYKLSSERTASGSSEDIRLFIAMAKEQAESRATRLGR